MSLSTILITGGGLLLGYFLGRNFYIAYKVRKILTEGKIARFEITWASGATTHKELRYSEENQLPMLSQLLALASMRQDGDTLVPDQVKAVKIVHRNWPDQET